MHQKSYLLYSNDMKCNIRPQQVTGTCLYREWTLHCWSQCHVDISMAVIKPSSHLVRSVLLLLSAVLLLRSVEPLLIQDPSSACDKLPSSAESFSTLRLVISLSVKWRGNAGSAQHAALTLEVSHPLLEGEKMAWLNTKNFRCAVSWNRCENLVVELVLWPATVVILWRLFVHRFFVLVAPLNCICIANETDRTLHSVPSAAYNSRDASEMFFCSCFCPVCPAWNHFNHWSTAVWMLRMCFCCRKFLWSFCVALNTDN